MRVLTFTMLFPNPAQPAFGIFVENRLRHLVANGQVTAQVMAPVPWFPFTHPRFGSWGRLAAVPRREERHGIVVHHPRFLAVPKVGTALTPLLMYAGLRDEVRRLATAHRIDIIDAHYFYPDGVAAALLGRELGIPVVITGRGTDLNLIPRHPLARRQIRWAAQQARGIITVCAALAEPLVRMGIRREKITVLRNGIDLKRFQPQPRDLVRAELGLDGPVLASVGWLIRRKGHHIVLDAVARLPGVTLLIVGSGPEGGALAAQAERLGIAGRVRFLGQLPHERLPDIYSAADALVLASDREGWANVLLESMACGTPVIASDVWGTAEAVTSPDAGVLFAPLDAAALADAATRLLAAPPDRAATRAYAEHFSWDETTRGQIRLFSSILHAPAAERRDETVRP